MALLEVLDNNLLLQNWYSTLLLFTFCLEFKLHHENVKKNEDCKIGSILNFASYLYKEIVQAQLLSFDEQLRMLEFLILKQYL